jgi:hypothetical protein
MLLGVGLAPLAPSPIARARIVSLGSLGCERFASGFDCSKAALPARLGNACIAMTAPALLDGLAA